MAGTDLAKVAQQLPAHLRGVSADTSSEFGGGIGASFPLPFLSVRGKEFRLRKDGQELNTRKRELNVVLVRARDTLSKRFYEEQYSSGSTETPDCSSKDSVHPDVANPVAPNCTHCPNNQWGSRISESGKEAKACQDYKRIVVWAFELTEEPLVLDVSATSLKAPKGQRHEALMLGDYLNQLTKHGMDPTQVITRIEFTDAEYPQLCFDFVSFVDEEQWAKVQELRENEDVISVVDNDVFEPNGETKEQKAESTPKAGKTTRKATQSKPKAETKSKASSKSKAETGPKKDSIPPFPGKTTIMKYDNGEMTIAEDEAQWALAWKDGARPQEARQPGKDGPAPGGEMDADAGAEEQGQESEPATSDEDDEEGDDDLLSQVTAMLGGKG